MKKFALWQEEVVAQYGDAATDFVEWDFLRYGVRIHDFPFAYSAPNDTWRMSHGLGAGAPAGTPEACVSAYMHVLQGILARTQDTLACLSVFSTNGGF